MMNEEQLSNLLLHYGIITSDIETKEEDGYRRIRTFRYNGKCFYHHMFNGELIEIFEI